MFMRWLGAGLTAATLMAGGLPPAGHGETMKPVGDSKGESKKERAIESHWEQPFGINFYAGYGFVLEYKQKGGGTIPFPLKAIRPLLGNLVGKPIDLADSYSRFVGIIASDWNPYLIAAAQLHQWNPESDEFRDLESMAALYIGSIPWIPQIYYDDPQIRMEQLIEQSEDMRQIEKEWRRIWGADQPLHLTYEKAHGSGSSEATCPYLQKPSVEKKAPKFDPNTLEDDTLKQMSKLIEARKKYEEAESIWKHGSILNALPLYEEVRALCPGSRFDQMATNRLKEIEKAVRSGSFGISPARFVTFTPTGTVTPDLGTPILQIKYTVEEREPHVVGQVPGKPAVSPSSGASCPYYQNPGIEKADPGFNPITRDEDTLKQMTRLLKAKELFEKAEALRAKGANAEAEKLYKQVQKLCPQTWLDAKAARQLKELENCGVFGIVTPAGFVTPDLGIPLRPRGESGETSEPAAPAKEEEHALVPRLPGIEPKIVEVLEKVLAGCPDILPVQLVVQEINQGGAEAQEPPAARWQSETSPEPIPTFEVEWEKAELRVKAEKEEATRAKAITDLGQVVLGVFDSIREEICIDIDASRKNGLRGQVEMRIGGMDFKLTYDQSGLHWVVN